MAREQTAADRLIAEIQGRVMIEQFELALQGTGLNATRFARIIANEVRRTPGLADCPRDSVIGAAMTCAELGFEPGPALGHAWIIPRRFKDQGVVANFQLGYKGLVALLWESDRIAWINARVVCERDRFEYSLGSPPGIRLFEPHEDPGEYTHVFASIGIRGGAEQLEVWTRSQMQHHMDTHVHDASRAWETDFDVMACKTLLGKAARYAPISPRARRALTLDELGERGLEQPFNVERSEPTPEPDLPESFAEGNAQAKRNAELREKLEQKVRTGRKGSSNGPRSRRTRV